jgi:hypothetical protein
LVAPIYPVLLRHRSIVFCHSLYRFQNNSWLQDDIGHEAIVETIHQPVELNDVASPVSVNHGTIIPGHDADIAKHDLKSVAKRLD